MSTRARKNPERRKLAAVQAILRELALSKNELAGVNDRRRKLRSRIGELEAALHLQGDKQADAYFRAIEEDPKNEPAIAGRIGVSNG